MDDLGNPYAAPSATLDQSDPLAGQHPVTPAGHGARFVNFVIDSLAQSAIGFVLGILAIVIGGEEAAAFIEKTPDFFLGVPILLAYYVILEGTTSRTLGKLITGTKVVNEHGGTPTLGQIVGRSFCRLIPFEPFSFLGTPSRGWHDSIPNTMVVKTR